MPNLVNMADRVTPPVLNPGCASRFDVGRCYAADTRQEDKPRSSVRTAGHTSLCLPLSVNIKLQRAVSCYEMHAVVPVFVFVPCINDD